MISSGRKAAGLLADSCWFRRGRAVWERNQHDLEMPLTRLEKLAVGAYLILHDFSAGLFPPAFGDQSQAHEAEVAYCEITSRTLKPGAVHCHMTKPFWFGKAAEFYLNHFIHLNRSFLRHGVQPPQKVLELGCGGGWMCEFLAVMGFQVVGTTIAPYDVEIGLKRAQSLKTRELPSALEFRVAPMETVDERVRDLGPFDAVFAYEALHHCYDWRQTLRSAYACLKPGGRLFLFNEPNLLHTCVAYRVAKISHTHEIGFNPGEVRRVLRACGFKDCTMLQNRFHCFIAPFSLTARK